MDIELGDFRDLSIQQHWMIKGLLYIAQKTSEWLIHFLLCLICLLLFSSANPYILSEYSCIVISLLAFCLMIFLMKYLRSIFRKSKDKFSSVNLKN